MFIIIIIIIGKFKNFYGGTRVPITSYEGVVQSMLFSGKKLSIIPLKNILA